MIPDGKSLTHKNQKPDTNNTFSKSRADKGCLRVPIIPTALSTCPPTPQPTKWVLKGDHQVSSNVPVTHIHPTLPPQPRVKTSWQEPTRDALEERGRRERKALGTLGWALFQRPGSTPPRPCSATWGSPRSNYSHFVRQPRVGRQCDLKRDLRPEKQSRGESEWRSGLRLKDWSVVGKHLHGGTGQDRNHTPTTRW